MVFEWLCVTICVWNVLCKYRLIDCGITTLKMWDLSSSSTTYSALFPPVSEYMNWKQLQLFTWQGPTWRTLALFDSVSRENLINSRWAVYVTSLFCLHSHFSIWLMLVFLRPSFCRLFSSLHILSHKSLANCFSPLTLNGWYFPNYRTCYEHSKDLIMNVTATIDEHKRGSDRGFGCWWVLTE